MITCPSCGHETHDYAWSCDVCGERWGAEHAGEASALSAATTQTDGHVEPVVDTTEVPSPQTKRCPFCAEEIKFEAIKCRFCGEMLDGSHPAAKGPAPQPKATDETKVFVIPFPDGSAPTRWPFKPGSKEPFSDSYLRSIGVKPKGATFLRRSFTGGVSYTWDMYKDHFLERINELGGAAPVLWRCRVFLPGGRPGHRR